VVQLAETMSYCHIPEVKYTQRNPLYSVSTERVRILPPVDRKEHGCLGTATNVVIRSMKGWTRRTAHGVKPWKMKFQKGMPFPANNCYFGKSIISLIEMVPMPE